jgi:hypothetical protein
MAKNYTLKERRRPFRGNPHEYNPYLSYDRSKPHVQSTKNDEESRVEEDPCPEGCERVKRMSMWR